MPETTDRDHGLRQKFSVERTRPSSRGIDHSACRYFVLDPLHDPIAKAALARYSQIARADGYFALANDLDQWLREIEETSR